MKLAPLLSLLGVFLTARISLGKSPALHIGVGVRKRIPLKGKDHGPRATPKDRVK